MLRRKQIIQLLNAGELSKIKSILENTLYVNVIDKEEQVDEIE